MAYLSVTPETAAGFRVSVGGHELIADRSPEAGGHGRGPTPAELFVASVAACAAETAAEFLTRCGTPDALVEVACHYETETQPLRVGSVQLTVHLREELAPELKAALLRSIYRCSVHASIAMPTQLSVALARAS